MKTLLWRIGFTGCSAFLLCTVLFTACSSDDPETIAVTGITLDDPKLELEIGAQKTLVVTLTPANASNRNVTWKSSHPEVATVENGVVTALKAGKTTITATTEDGGFTDITAVTVTGTAIAVTGVAMDKTTVTLGSGDEESLVATVLPENASNGNLNWESSNPGVATVQNGKVTAVSDGETVITATTEDGEFTASTKVYVSWLGRVTFRSNKTWTVGSQLWSDAVMAEGCDKDDYNGGPYMPAASDEYLVDGLRNPGYGDWFSWQAVHEYKDALCPDGWRVPTMDDMVALDIALGGDGENHAALDGSGYTPEPYLSSKWDAEYGGYCWMYNELTRDYVGTYACYWTQTESGEDRAYALNLGTQYGYRSPRGSGGKMNGHTVRCVADI